MRELLLILVTLFLAAGIPAIHADDGDNKSAEGTEAEPECD